MQLMKLNIMKFFTAIKLIFKDRELFIIKFFQRFPLFCTDEYFLKLMFKKKMGKTLNLNHPQTFNEKLQWMKLYYRNPLLTTLVDKIAVKDYVAKKIGEKYIIPTIQEWNSFEEINFHELPKQFVLKTNHDYGGVVICKNIENFDYHTAKRKLNKHLSRNFFYSGREWAYKNVKPKLFAEQYMVDRETNELRDFKFFCFDGKPQLLYIATDRQNPEEPLKYDFYDLDFNHLPFSQKTGISNFQNIKKPRTFSEMISLCEILSRDLPHVRVDFYEINGRVYFGELTFYHDSGFQRFNPEVWDYNIGSYLNLPNKYI